MINRILSIALALLIYLTSPLEAAKEWQEIKGQNFIIYYRDDALLDFAQTVMDSAEDEFKYVTGNLGITRYQGWGWERRAAIYIYRDEEDYVNNGGAGWSHGSASVEEKIIRTYPSAHGFFDSLLPHELGHIILREFIGFTVAVPLWFEEGVAMYQEKAKRLGADKAVKEAIEKGQFIPLSKLTDMQLYKDADQSLVDLFYAESASIVYFLITQLGEQRFYSLCRELKDNTPFTTALSRVYVRIKDLDALNKMWVDHLKGQ